MRKITQTSGTTHAHADRKEQWSLVAISAGAVLMASWVAVHLEAGFRAFTII